jgi:hypothetical protein
MFTAVGTALIVIGIVFAGFGYLGGEIPFRFSGPAMMLLGVILLARVKRGGVSG